MSRYTPRFLSYYRFPLFMSQLEPYLDAWLSRKKPRGLVAIVLANPADKFVKDAILPRMEYWHRRSSDHLMFVSFGFRIPPVVEAADFSGRLQELMLERKKEKAKAVKKIRPVFDQTAYACAIEELEQA